MFKNVRIILKITFGRSTNHGILFSDINITNVFLLFDIIVSTPIDEKKKVSVLYNLVDAGMSEYER